MNIGVIGYYGFGNAGDDVILENLQRILEPHRTIPIPVGLLNGPDSVRRLNAFDFLVLGGGGLFRDAPPSPFGIFDEWSPALQTPIGVLGLGVTRLDERFAEATRQLAERAVFFVVRDEESRRIIGHPKVQVAADLTFYHPFRPTAERSATGEQIIGVNLRPAHAGIDRWTAAIRGLNGRTRAISFSAHPTLGDHDALLTLDPDCPNHFSIDMYAGLDLLVGTAFHSLVFAIQTATPVVAINYDPKVSRLMHEAGLEDYMLEWDAWDDLVDCVERVRADREVIRRRMADYTAQAERELHAALEIPKQLVEEYAERMTMVSTPASKPTASVIVNAVNASAADVARTLASCRAQTYTPIEILVVTDQPAQAAVTDRALVRTIELGDAQADWVSAGLAKATGAYISWLDAGVWYTDDALALLVDTLEQAPEVTLAHACYFLTQDGLIERKVKLDSAQTPGRAVRLGPGFVVRRDAADEIWTQIKRGANVANLLDSQARYVKSALVFTPATDAESRLYRSLVAYSRGDIVTAKGTLQMLQPEKRRDVAHQHDIVDLITAIAGNAPVVADPLDVVELVFDNLPDGFDDIMRLKRQVVAQLLMKRFYEMRIEPASTMDALRTAIRAIRHDPKWLRNRGVWVRALYALRTAAGGATRSAYQAVAPWTRKTDYI